MEFYADTQPGPWEIPADALAVLVWRDDRRSPRYEFVCVVVGAATLAEIRDPLGQQFPWLDGRPVVITKIGGTSSRVRRLRLASTVNVAVTEETVAALV